MGRTKKIENIYAYYIRSSKGARPHRSGWNQQLDNIKCVINEKHSFYTIHKKIGKRSLKILEYYAGEQIFEKEGHEIELNKETDD